MLNNLHCFSITWCLFGVALLHQNSKDNPHDVHFMHNAVGGTFVYVPYRRNQCGFIHNEELFSMPVFAFVSWQHANMLVVTCLFWSIEWQILQRQQQTTNVSMHSSAHLLKVQHEIFTKGNSRILMNPLLYTRFLLFFKHKVQSTLFQPELWNRVALNMNQSHEIHLTANQSRREPRRDYLMTFDVWFMCEGVGFEEFLQLYKRGLIFSSFILVLLYFLIYEANE